MFFFIIFLLINLSHSVVEWNCNENKQIQRQCTINIEYEFNQYKKQICSIHSLTIHHYPTLTNVPMKKIQINFCQLNSTQQIPLTLPVSVNELDLSDNNLGKFTLSFPLSAYLKVIRLDRNPNLIEFDFGPKNSHEQLRRLSLRHNHQIQLTDLPKNLIELDLTDCHLSLKPSILFALKSLRKLTHLSLANNQLKQINANRLPMQQLHYLNLSKNHLTIIDKHWLNKHLQTLDLSSNQIRSLEVFDEFLLRRNQTLQLSLSNNPLLCDCWFTAVRRSAQIILTDRASISCSLTDDYLCRYSRYCPSDCTCCDFEACDCHLICPVNCICSHDIYWTRHIVSCQRMNLSSMHLTLPETLTELNYEENSIEQVKSSIFIGKNFLRKINLASNHLRILTNETFCAATNLYELNLSSNTHLTNLSMDLFECLKNLEVLILSSEQIYFQHDWLMIQENDLIYLKRQRNSTIKLHHQEIITTTTMNFNEYNQTLIIVIFFFLIFILFFSIFLIILTICRRKLREHLNHEIQRQCKPIENIPMNEGIYEQVSSDSEQPFLYSNQPPILPPYQPYCGYRPYDYSQTIIGTKSNVMFIPSTICQCQFIRS